MNAQYDFLVIGDDEASLCAAAAAARAGARAAHLRLSQRKKNDNTGAAPAIPNFVWRRLDLQDYDLTLEPVSARVTLFKDADPLVTYVNSRQTREALAEKGMDDHHVWDDFVREITALDRSSVLADVFGRATALSGTALAQMLLDPEALERNARLFGDGAALMDDWFEDERVRAHLIAHALAPAGASDRDAASASAVAEFFDADAWRVRTPKDSARLMAVLEQVCQDAGVVSYVGKLAEIGADGGRFANIVIGADEKLKVRHVFFATPEAASNAGALNGAVGAQLNGAAHACVTVRFKLTQRIEPPAGDYRSIFEIVDDANDVRQARDAAVAGQLYDRPPVEFEYTPNGEIIARTAYFPGAFYEDGEWRGWTGQDRQAAAAIIKNRIASRMPDFATQIKRAETQVTTPNAQHSRIDARERIIVQQRRHGAIGAAVRLIDEVMARDE